MGSALHSLSWRCPCVFTASRAQLGPWSTAPSAPSAPRQGAGVQGTVTDHSHTDWSPLGAAPWHSLGLVFGALQVCMVLLYGVQGDVADVAGVAALQACKENPELMNPELKLFR